MMHLRRLRVLVALGLAALSLAAAPASHAAASGETYVVRANDTLWGIAQASGTTVSSLMALNNLSDANRLAVGQVLVIPTTSSLTTISTVPAAASAATNTTAAGTLYIVRAGDTLSDIALRFGISLDALGNANNLPDWCTLSIGQRLVIPTGVTTTVAPATVAADSTTTTATTNNTIAAVPSTAIDSILVQQALNAGVDISLVKAVAWQESGWQMITAQDGGIGVMQLMPYTVDWISTSLLGYRINPYDAADNVHGGVVMLHYFLRFFGGDVRQALAAYHQGLTSVQTQGISAECAHYIANVLALQVRFSG